METLTLINGNNQKYNIGLPKIMILGNKWSDTVISHVYENTGLRFKGDYVMEAQPETSEQIVKLLLTYNFKTQYHNNLTSRNTLYLKSDHHTGFEVDSICLDCCKENHINTNGLKEGDRLAC